MLDGNYEPAIEALQRALATEPNASATLLDLGTAYLLRAEADGNDEHDYALAIEYQSRMLAHSPDDPVALFNRAVAEEKASLYDRAEEDWKHFFQTERDSAWLAEGRQRYASLVEKIQRSRQPRADPIRDPSQASSALRSDAGRTDDADWPKSLDEAYLQMALTQWLAVITSPGRGDSPEVATTWDALSALAEALHRRHSDEWLTDLLAGPRSPQCTEGVRELSAAVRANEKGDAAEGIVHARRSFELFGRVGNEAGEAGAELEFSHGLDQSQQGDQCLTVGLRGLRAAARQRYPWVEAGDSYELAICLLLRGNPDQAMKLAARGETSARRAEHAVLALLGRFYLDGVATPAVAESESWNRIRDGLREYWQSPYPPTRGGDFYTDLGIVAQMEQDWHFAKAVGQEAVLMRSQERTAWNMRPRTRCWPRWPWPREMRRLPMRDFKRPAECSQAQARTPAP